MGYKAFIEPCKFCGVLKPKRELNKVLIAPPNPRYTSYKKISALCDDCLPRLSEFLGVEL